jgi:DNA-directed RNA polymerase subunit M/transcription elongation factor TFIIS
MSIHLTPAHALATSPNPHVECPECADERCRPLAVTSRLGGVTVQYRCDGCGHEWSVDEPRAPLFGSVRHPIIG